MDEVELLETLVNMNTAWMYGAGHEGELADKQDAAVGHIGDGEVHHPVGIIENAQSYRFAAEPVDVFVGVGIFYAEEDEHALPYL